MPSFRNHTHCQAAQKANTQSKTCQRVWLPQHMERLLRIKQENTTPLRRKMKKMVSSLNFMASSENFKPLL